MFIFWLSLHSSSVEYGRVVLDEELGANLPGTYVTGNIITEVTIQAKG